MREALINDNDVCFLLHELFFFVCVCLFLKEFAVCHSPSYRVCGSRGTDVRSNADEQRVEQSDVPVSFGSSIIMSSTMLCGV